MKVFSFALYVPDNKSIITEEIELPHFYPYLHQHNEWQLTWVEQGDGTLITGNNMHPFGSGDIFLIGPNLPHLFKSNPEYFESDNEKCIKACSIYFNLSGALTGMFALPEMKIANSFFEKYKKGLKIPNECTELVIHKMKEISSSNGLDMLVAFLKLVEVLRSLKDEAQPLCSDVFYKDGADNEEFRLSKILNFIMENYSTQISLEDVANAAYMTPHSFCRYFKKHTGHTFISFLNEVRINDACKSLISDQKSTCISGVAYKVGFSSITNFNRVFKSIIGQSPSAYLDSYRTHSSTPYPQTG